MALVSIIITVYNGEKFVGKTINSVLTQAFQDFELIIINDCSKDNSEKIIEWFNDSRIVYKKNSNNLNIVESRNIWLRHATGKYICLLDQDDVLEETKLEKQYNFMEQHQEYWLVWCNIININEHDIVLWETIVPEEDYQIRERLLRSSQFACWAVMMRKELLDKTWLLDPNFIKCDDYDLWLRLGILGKMHNLQERLFRYRYHLNNTSKSSHKEMALKSLKLCIKYRKYYPNFLISLMLWIWYLVVPQKISSKILKLLKN